MAIESFFEVADSFRMKGKTRERYVKYMLMRWPAEERQMCRSGYASEWALRFLEGKEYLASDPSGQKILQQIWRTENNGA